MKTQKGPDHALPGVEEAARLEPETLFARFGASPAGLTRREAAARIARLGPNAVARERPLAPLRRLLQLFLSPLSLLLLALAILAQLSGEAGGALVIAVMVVLSVLLSWFQEVRSGKAAERLRAMVHTTATVLRRERAADGGRPHEIPIARLAPGDVVQLAAGDLVPADVRLLESKDLFVDQSALTGESMPAEKHAAVPPGAASAAELPNVAFLGTHVVSGTATALVMGTGARTRFGSIAASIAAEGQPTSFDLGVKRFIGLMLRFMLVMVPLVFLINGLSKGNWVEAFLFAVAVAVGLTPEMLPMVVTINLAKGALAMSRKKVIVKRLSAIQNLGAMNVLCTDKTGTLTQNKVILEKHVDILGAESAHVLELAYLNSHFQSGLKNLLDVAVLEHAEMREHVHIPRSYRKIDEVPFDFRRRRMSVMVARDPAHHVLICKGAPEETIAVCAHVEEKGKVVPLTAAHRADLLPFIRSLNEEGFRVIAVAYKHIPAAKTVCSRADESGLVLAGYIAFLDPPKESAAGAVRALHEQGVGVKVLTGDNEVVTKKICAMVGIDPGTVVLGGELDRMDDAALAQLAARTAVFAKLEPEHKARIIAALRSGGHVVGYLGDGINDGPALRAADVGVSVSGAADIAKESADIILLEKSLLVLRDGVIEGRRVFANVVKYIRMGASSAFGNMFSVVGASAFLPFLPMAPVQVLLNNLLYDVSQTALATDSVDAAYLARPRKWDIGNIGRYMLVFGPISSLFDYATFFTLLYAFRAWHDPALFQSGWFVESVLSQTLIVHVIRTAGVPFLESRAAAPLLVTTVAVCAAALWLPFSDFAGLLGLTPLPARYFLALAAILSCYLILTQWVKTALIRRFGFD
ncbi:MAG TPA: magnesium-translocating P-type ATPase [Burkholderiales bacterium]|nr:magnesium-translocating P-type ATPase [Burkholderiales bacterium]